MIVEFDGTTEQFARAVRELFPRCRICEDDDGQIVIYTGGMVQMGGEVVEWLPDDEDVYQSWCDRNPEVM
jgi:predicted metal-dependent RNase